MVNEEMKWLGQWLGSVLCIPLSALILLIVIIIIIIMFVYLIDDITHNLQ